MCEEVLCESALTSSQHRSNLFSYMVKMQFKQKPPYTIGTSSFDPNEFIRSWDSINSVPLNNDFRDAIIRAFRLPSDDNYVYHAVASVTLPQVQSAIDAGRANGLCAWYRDGANNEVHMISYICF
jgi:hypothetical protein